MSDGSRSDAGKVAIDPIVLRAAFGAFATGVTVITTIQADGTPRGFTANSFTSVSLDPPLLLVCLAKSAHSCETFMAAPHFAVNVLAEDQKAISGLFASRERGKFEQCGWTAGAGQAPLIEGAIARFTCAREQLVDAGDHVILIGRVIEVDSDKGNNPLGYFRGRYFSIGIENNLVQAAASYAGTRVGAVLAGADAVLMEDRGGRLNLPLSPGPRPTIEALEARLRTLGLSPETDFLYAVFDDRARGEHGIYYHGKVSGPLPDGLTMVSLADLATAPIANEAEAQMLSRFAEEYRHGTFGIYQGNETTGAVRRVGGA